MTYNVFGGTLNLTLSIVTLIGYRVNYRKWPRSV